MTIKEAIKIIELCTDSVKRGSLSEEKTYISKDYVISILDMVDSVGTDNIVEEEQI